MILPLTMRPAIHHEIVHRPPGFNLLFRGVDLFESAFLAGYLCGMHVRLSDENGGSPSHAAMLAETRFLRVQLAMFLSRGVRPRQATPLERIQLVFYSLFFEWKESLVVVKPATLIRWQRKLTALNWAFISKVFTRKRTGRPPIKDNLRDLILQMASDNPLWSPRDIAENLKDKFGLDVAHRTVAKYLKPLRADGSDSPGRSQSWSTFIRNHLGSTIACDFAQVTTVAFTRLWILVVLDLGTRRVLHLNVTAHPTAEWTTQQFRDAIPADHAYRFLVHDRDKIFSEEFDQAIRGMGIEPLKSPPRSPQANAYVERVIGTLRRGCLDHIIPLGESHVREKVLDWKSYYNHSRPHMALGGRCPDPPPDLPAPLQSQRHHLPANAKIVARPYLGGLHHDYRLAA